MRRHTFTLLVEVLGESLEASIEVTLSLGCGLQLQPLLYLLALDIAGLDGWNGRHVSVVTYRDQLQTHAACDFR